ncbi:MAG: TonB-linked SusC/RagA family outer membrane protein [Algoriphagus sp.]|jgi:TonB-linked SusC/RagA family outer membrane protein
MRKIYYSLSGFLCHLSVFLLAFAFTVSYSFAQEGSRMVSGIVTDDTGDEIVGASVTIKGTYTGTSSDAEGKYSLTVPSAQSVLVFTFVGFSSQEILVGNQSLINVILALDSKTFDEVVVVGYGTQKKVNLTGAVGIAGAERLENRPIASVGEGLQGVIPNLNVNVRNGDPSAPITFNIRGYESINGGSPLILVDNVPMDLNRINPNDIKSISVLKDASAAAVYGARAAFGVVLVETKKGSEGKVRVNLNSQFSLAKPIFNMDMVTDPHDFVNARNLANIRTNGAPSFDDDYVEGTRRWSENPTFENAWGVYEGDLRFYGFNDYKNQIMTDYAPTSQHDLSISGGSENASYYVSFGHFAKDGYLKPGNNEKFTRNNILMKADFKINDWLSLQEKVVFNNQNSDKPHFYNWDVNINSLARVTPNRAIQFPDLPFYLEQGDREKYEPLIGKYFGGTNFFPYLLDGGRTTSTNNDAWLSQGITLTPIKGLKIQGDFSYNMFSREFKDVQSKIDIVTTDLTDPNPVTNGFSGDDWVRNRSDNDRYSVLNAYAEYTFPMLAKKHDVKAMVGFNQESGNYRYFQAQGRQLITPLVPNINATTGVQQVWGGEEDFALRGAFYRLNYRFDDKYLLELNGRYDLSSRFPTDSRSGFFPSVSAGWRVSGEDFMASTSNWLDNLKFRASYGTLGNQIIQSGNRQIYYPAIPSMGSGFSPYMMNSGLIPFVSASGLVSPSLTWESVTSQNIGLDFTMLKSRLDVSFDLFTRDTKNMLMNVNYPDILGTSAPRENAADLRNKGWETSITWRDRIKNNWSYDVTLALADSQAEITKFMNETGAFGGSNFRVGQKLGEIWGFETVGIFQSDDDVASAPDQSRIGNNWRAGDVQYADLNGDGKIDFGDNTVENPGDRKIIGNTSARYTFGVNGSLAYKNFRVTAFFQGIGSKDHWPTSGNWTWFFPFNAGHVENYFLTETWSETNREAYFPAPHISTNDKKNVQVQSRYLQNAGYIRLKNLTFSYDLPTPLLSKIGLSNAQIYTTGMNLWEFTKMRKPLDPETIQSGAIEYPMQRIFTLGVNISL